MGPFMVRLVGAFYSFELYDAKGRRVFTLSDATAAAETLYGDAWTEVYNGSEGCSRPSG